MSVKENVIEELTRLNLMSGRIPYTHHHDYVRITLDKARLLSRSQVAQLDADEDELYACAFLQAVETMTTKQKISSDICKMLYRNCSQIAELHLAKLSEEI